MNSVALALPLALLLLTAALIAVVLALTAAPSRHLPRPVAHARRHSRTGATAAIVTGTGCAVVVPTAAATVGSAPGVALLVAPLAFALGHTAALLLTEATWPRQTTSVRAALLTHRSPADAAPRWLRTTFWVAAALVAAASVIGWATADASGRAMTTTGGGGLGVEGGWEATHSPYPGALYALPALVGTTAVVIAVQLGLRLVATRPAVPLDDRSDIHSYVHSGSQGGSAERALRRASGHRLLRGASAGLLTLAGGLLYVMGTATHAMYTGRLAGTTGQEVLQGYDPLLQTLGTAAAVLGGLSLLAAAVVLLIPAPRVPASSQLKTPVPPARPAAM